MCYVTLRNDQLMKSKQSTCRLYILCCLPFAGKSTVARALHERFSYTIVSIDAINGERGLGLNAAPITPHEWDETYAEGYDRLAAALSAGATVLFDAPNYTRAQRDDLRRIAAVHGVSACVLYLAVPAAVCRERWQRNRQTSARYDVRDEDVAEVLTRFEPPEADERVLYFDQSEPLADWIKRVFG